MDKDEDQIVVALNCLDERRAWEMFMCAALSDGSTTDVATWVADEALAAGKERFAK